MTNKNTPEKSAKSPLAPKSAQERASRDPDSHERALAAAAAVIDKKAERVKILHLGEASGFTDYFVICSALSDRQVLAVAEEVQTRLRERFGLKAVSVEGITEGRWVLLDYGDVVIHIFLDALRDYYNLDGLWADAEKVAVPSEYYGSAATRLE